MSIQFSQNQFDFASHNKTDFYAENIIRAAHSLLETTLALGRKITKDDLRNCMTTAFNRSDQEGAWIWKDAYEAQEIAGILFLRKYKQALHKHRSYELLKVLDKLQSMMMTQTRRSDQSIAYQQFSTPFTLARITAEAAQITSDDVVLEPSAGTGILAGMAEMSGASVWLNEYETHRYEILRKLFGTSRLGKHNAEYLNDLYDQQCQPSVVLMNPPFSNSPTMHKTDLAVSGRHVFSALRRLREGGRLVAITGHNFAPHNQVWKDAFARLQEISTVVYTVPLAGKIYYKHGTSFETRLTVFDKVPAQNPSDFSIYDRGLEYDLNVVMGDLLQIVQRQPLEEVKAVKPAIKLVQKPSKPKALIIDEPIKISDAETLHYTIQDHTAAMGLSDDLYQTYHPQVIKIEGAKPHPTKLVQSAAMSSVKPPVPTAKPKLPKKLISDGVLSDAQLESVIYAEEAHSKILPETYKIDKHFVITSHAEEYREVSFRRGWFLGDGTGCGKGRQIAGIIMSNFAQGRKRAIWITKNDKLLEDAKRDWQALGGDTKQIISLSKFAQGTQIKLGEGILFVTYGTLRTSAKQGKISRVEQIVNWAGREFDGVIAFDESHAMANAVSKEDEFGTKGTSQQAEAGMKLQRALADARVVYVSATGATEVSNLAYAERLGLWGEGTCFTDQSDFVSSINEGGVTAMEVISRDMKAMGLYTARSLSYDGVEVDILEHELTKQQIHIYNSYSKAYAIIHNHIQKALEACNVTGNGKALNKRQKAAAMSIFESSKQRFLNHLITGMKCLTLIRTIEQDIVNGHAPVIQIVSTSEALLMRRLDNVPLEEWNDLNIDITPKEYILNYLQTSFPVQLFELSQEDGKAVTSEPLYDCDGNPVLNQEAVAMRDKMVEQLASLPPVPSALDQIIHHFGHDNVAEVTGRSIRQICEDGIMKVNKRPANANLYETQAFMDDRKRILIFSDAGGTGRSYHADLNCKNQRQRIHYMLEPGWRADNAVQGLGRTNRTNQASAPIFRPVTTNVKGEKRFLSTIARRLDTLGAITKGQRETGGQGLFRAEDNLESQEARQSLVALLRRIDKDEVDGCSKLDFESQTGLKLRKDNGEEDFPSTPRFLNRLLAMPIEMQNYLYESFAQILNSYIEQLRENGILNVGIQTITADSLIVKNSEGVYQDKQTGAKAFCNEIERKDKLSPLSIEDALYEAGANAEFVTNAKSGFAALKIPTNSITCLDTGMTLSRVRLIRPTERKNFTLSEYEKTEWEACSEQVWREAWQKQINALPTHKNTEFVMITGTLLPIWRMIGGEDMKIYRVITNDGEVLLGRKLEGTEIYDFKQMQGIKNSLPPAEEMYDLIMQSKSFTLNNGMRIKRSLVMGEYRVEIITQDNAQIDKLVKQGCYTEIIQYQRKVFVNKANLHKILAN